MQSLGFDLRVEASVSALTDEVVKSSAIEGEHLDPGEVRSSVARKLGLDVAGLPQPGREVDGVVAMMLDATHNFDDPLTAERLFGWHAALFPHRAKRHGAHHRGCMANERGPGRCRSCRDPSDVSGFTSRRRKPHASTTR